MKRGKLHDALHSRVCGNYYIMVLLWLKEKCRENTDREISTNISKGFKKTSFILYLNKCKRVLLHTTQLKRVSLPLFK